MSKYEFLKSKIEHLGHLISGKGISPMKQKVKAITELAPTTNIIEARHIIGLIGYYRKFFLIFSDVICQINKLSRENAPFKWMDQYQKSLDYIKQVITTCPILTYPEPDKQYYLFTDSSKHSWGAVLVQYSEHEQGNGRKLNIPHPIASQSGTLHG